MAAGDPDPDGFALDFQRWHDEHEGRRADRHGFLAITGLHWLTPQPQRFPDAPGEWATGPQGVTVALAEDEELVVGGVPVRGRHSFGHIPERGGVNATFGDAVVELAKRGGHDIIRPRHPTHRRLLDYTGTATFAPDRRWVTAGRFVPYDSPRPVTVGAAVEGLQHVYESPGRVDFDLDGRSLTLVAFNGANADSLFVLFTDATSGVTTHAACRSLSVDPPDDTGRVVLDFNRAVNLPCAYTPFATCPLPPAENRLSSAIAAGEKAPTEHPEAD